MLVLAQGQFECCAVDLSGVNRSGKLFETQNI